MLVDQGKMVKLEPKGDEIFIMEQGNSYNLWGRIQSTYLTKATVKGLNG